MTEIEEQALKEFLLDINCLNRLNPWKEQFNLFDVLKISHMEIRHSNILAWLLDPNENHQIGDRFIKEFISRVVAKMHGEYNAFDLLLQDFFSYQVYRESDHIDIKLVSRDEKTVFVIENKVWSGESSHQLNDYYNVTQNEYAEYRIIYVFLTPDGHDSSNPDVWISFSYEEIISALQISTYGLSLSDEVNLLIKNYIDIVKEKIMKEKDVELVKICNEIYNKHRTALRLIFENVSVNTSVESEIICNTLNELNDEGIIIYPGNNSWMFFTKEMSDFLPDLAEPNSSWGTNYVYYYWFEKYEETLYIHFEIGGVGLTEKMRENELKLIKASNKKEKDDFRYYRLFLKKAKINQDDYEGSLKKAVRDLVNAALENEKKILRSANGLM